MKEGSIRIGKKEGIKKKCFYVLYPTLLHLPPSDFDVSEDAGIEPRTETSALAVRSSKHFRREN